MQSIVVKTNKERLDKYLAQEGSYSRSTIIKMIEAGLVLVNKKVVKPSFQVKEGDVIEITSVLEEKSDLSPTPMDLDIVYEDDAVLVINKPTGLVVHPGSGNKNNTLANGLLYYTKNLSDQNGTERPGIVHRLDKDTSGLMLICKSNEAHNILSEDFKNHQVKREYIALLCGVFPHNKAKIDAPIGRDLKNRKQMAVVATHSKPAITHLEVLKRFKKNTLVRLYLETGRTHQIRVHMKYIGYPVFNDPVYHQEKIKGIGQFLHSKTIRFVHPITKKKMYFESDLPAYFSSYLETLEEK